MPQIRLISGAVTPVELSNLLLRLSPEERATVVERRLGPNAGRLDTPALADRLARPDSINAALAEVNAGQLLLLRWLAEQPRLRVSWPELNDALGDRLTPELREYYLRDLRLWALADFSPDPKKGFFATYPAVVSSLPTGREIRLRPRLDMMTSDLLLKACTVLGLKNAPTRKDGRIDLLMAALTDPARCRAFVDGLSRPARELFDWVREQGGWVGAAEMRARAPDRNPYGGGYYGVESFWRPPRGKGDVDPLAELVQRLLVVPLTPYAGSWYAPTAFAIPLEVEMAFSGRGILDRGPLQPPPFQPAEPVSIVVPTPGTVLRDLGHLLGFIGAGKCEWKQDGYPYKRSLVALGKLLGQSDAAYVETLWTLAALAGMVRPVRGDPPRFEPVEIGDVRPEDLLGGLLLGWISDGTMSDLPVDGPTIRQTARAQVLQVLQIMPADTWVLRSSVDALLRFQWPRTFAPEFRVWGASAPDPGWEPLGVLLVGHGSTADGQEAVMVPAAHQQLITPDDDDSASAGEIPQGVLPPWDNSWVVQPDRTIVVPPNAHPDAVGRLWKVAQLQSSQGASLFRITAESVAAALNRGMTPAEVRELLKQGSRVPLPPTVERLIEDQGQRYGRIKVGTAHTYVKTDDPSLLDELRRHKKLAKLKWQDVAPGVAFVVGDNAPAVLDSLRQAGYLPVLEGEKPRAVPARATDSRSPAPRGAARDRGDRRALLRLVNQAVEMEITLVVTWVDGGLPRVTEVEVLDLHEDELHAYDLDHDGKEIVIPLDSILELASGDPLDDDLIDDLLLDDEEPR